MELTPIELYKVLGAVGYVICLWEASRVFRADSSYNSVGNKIACVITVSALPLAAVLNAVGVNIWEGTALLCFVPILAYYVLKPPLTAVFLMTEGAKALKI